jgi:hypothetical protein
VPAGACRCHVVVQTVVTQGEAVDQAELQTGLAGLVRGGRGWETGEALQGKGMARGEGKGNDGLASRHVDMCMRCTRMQGWRKVGLGVGNLLLALSRIVWG